MIGWTDDPSVTVTTPNLTFNGLYTLPPPPPTYRPFGTPAQGTVSAAFIITPEAASLAGGVPQQMGWWSGVIVSSIGGTLQGTGPETRPINIDMMYVIAY
jgi:hypothetical protein